MNYGLGWGNFSDKIWIDDLWKKRTLDGEMNSHGASKPVPLFVLIGLEIRMDNR